MKPSCRMYKNGSCLSINNTTWFLIEDVLSLKHNHGTKNKTVYVSWEHQPTHWSWVLEIPCCTPFPNWTRLRWPIRTHKSNTSQTWLKKTSSEASFIWWLITIRRHPIILSENDWGVQSPSKRKKNRFHETILRRWLDPYTTPLYLSFPNTQRAEISTTSCTKITHTFKKVVVDRAAQLGGEKNATYKMGP